MSWTSYLPTVFQLPQLYFAMALCIAIVRAFKSFPSKYSQPWMVQLASIAVGCLIMLGQMGSISIVYALGSGVICGTLATSFYDLIVAQVELKVRAWLGVPQPPNLVSTPPTSTPPKTTP
jgi:hypothetical protein